MFPLYIILLCRFMGEDLMNSERIKAQKDQQKAWLQQQMKERQQANDDRNKAEREIQAALEARDKRALELADAERETRRLIQESTAKFNLDLVYNFTHIFNFQFY